MALECAKRREEYLKSKVQAATPIRLCTSQRVVRAQFFKQNPLFSAHFRLFSMCTAGKDIGNFRFETQCLLSHLSFYLKLMQESRQQGFEFKNIEVRLTELEESKRREVLQRQVLTPLRTQFPKTNCRFAPERDIGRGYYAKVCFHISAKNAAGQEINLVDGGFTDWTEQLLSNRKESLFISGLGTALVCKAFKLNASLA